MCDRARMVAKKFCSLVVLRNPSTACLLLGMKKKGFGVGKNNGFGGKVEPGETLQRCALREMEEESGVVIQPQDLQHVGFLTFVFDGREAEELHVHIFTARAHSGEPRETEEMAPAWVPEASVPYSTMWADDVYWLPHLLSGRRFRGTFHFEGHEKITSHTLDLLGEGERLCPYVEDARTCVLIPAGAAAQTAIDL